MADKQSTKPPGGTRDFLPDDVRRREYVIDVVRDVYERYGFEPLETPAFENIETLLGKYGEEGNKLIFKILKRGEHAATGEADLALRYDLTVPLARVVAQYQNELPKFFKRYQIQPVWRADRPARGRFREFYQCDIDSVGSTSPVVEVEILNAVTEILTTLRFDDFTIKLNHRQILVTLLNEFEFPPDQHANVLVELDKLDKIGEEGVAKALAARGLNQEAVNRLLSLLGAAHPSEYLDWFERQMSSIDDRGRAAFQNLRDIRGLVAETPAGGKVTFEPSLARGLSYYTGAIMEIAVEGIGSLGGGGRYDNLVGMFLGRDVPACGFSLGLERIIVLMTERKMFPDTVARGAVDILVTMWDEPVLRAQAVALAAELRRSGLRVEVYPEPDKLGKQFKYASDRKVPLVAVQGGDETSAGQVTIKDLADGQQFTVPRAEAGLFVAGRVNLEPST